MPKSHPKTTKRLVRHSLFPSPKGGPGGVAINKVYGHPPGRAIPVHDSEFNVSRVSSVSRVSHSIINAESFCTGAGH